MKKIVFAALVLLGAVAMAPQAQAQVGISVYSSPYGAGAYVGFPGYVPGYGYVGGVYTPAVPYYNYSYPSYYGGYYYGGYRPYYGGSYYYSAPHYHHNHGHYHSGHGHYHRH